MATANSSQEKAVQISKLIGTSMVLDLQPLREILCNANVSDKKIAVYVMTGEKKSGKSFLLNYILRYLRAEGAPDWFGAEDEPLVGFDWGGGPKKSTNGIWAWNKLFPIRGSRNEKIYVMLIDTEVRYAHHTHSKPFQGLDEFAGTDSQCANAFDLGVLLCSVQLHSMLQNVNIDFMSRKLFDTTRPSRALRSNERSRGNQIPTFYRNNSTYLLPRIGPEADGVITYDGRNAELGEEFNGKYKKFIEKWFSVSTLEQKKIIDFQFTCGDLYRYCGQINMLIKEEKLSLVSTDLFGYAIHEREKKMEYYESVMAERLKLSLFRLEHLRDLHEDLRRDLVLQLKQMDMPDDIYQSQYSRLEMDLYSRFGSIKEDGRYVKAKSLEDYLNDLLKDYKTQMKSRLTHNFPSSEDLDGFHETLKKDAKNELRKVDMSEKKRANVSFLLVEQLDYLYVAIRTEGRYAKTKHVVSCANKIFKNLKEKTNPDKLVGRNDAIKVSEMALTEAIDELDALISGNGSDEKIIRATMSLCVDHGTAICEPNLFQSP